MTFAVNPSELDNEAAPSLAVDRLTRMKPWWVGCVPATSLQYTQNFGSPSLRKERGEIKSQQESRGNLVGQNKLSPIIGIARQMGVATKAS